MYVCVFVLLFLGWEIIKNQLLVISKVMQKEKPSSTTCFSTIYQFYDYFKKGCKGFKQCKSWEEWSKYIIFFRLLNKEIAFFLF